MAKPKTVDECMAAFTEMFSFEEQTEFLKVEKEDLVLYHHGLGRWIRNNWELWEDNSPLKDHMSSLGFIHPDDMSQAIIEEYWNRMNNNPSELVKKAQESKEYWAKKEE